MLVGERPFCAPMTILGATLERGRAVSLRTRVTLFVVCALAALGGMLYGAVRVVVLSQVDAAERAQTRAHTLDVARVVATMTAEFAARGKDWSDWNDMQHFAGSPSAEWAASTFGCSVLTSTGWDLAVVHRADGRTVHQDFCAHDSRESVPIPAALQALLTRDGLYAGIASDAPAMAGIVRDGDRLILIASRAILSGEGRPGAVHARLVYGQLLDARWFERLRGFTGMDLTITPAPTAGLGASPRLHAPDPGALVGAMHLPGFGGAPVATLRVREVRAVTGYGQQILRTCLAAIALGGLIFGLVAVYAMRRAVLSPLEALRDGARGLAAGTAARVEVRGRDELGVLAQGFNDMADAIADRERRLARALDEVRLVLDATGDALVGCTLDGRLRGEASRAAREWFGEPPSATADVADWVFGAGTTAAATFRLGLEDIVADVMPYEVVSAQMPSRISRGGVSYGVGYRRIEADGALVALLVRVTDITADLAAERAARDARELQSVIGSILRDPADFERFLGEVEELLGALASEPQREARVRALHTLKGSTAIYGFAGFSEACHALEDRVAAAPNALDGAEVVALRGKWSEAVARVLRFAPSSGSRVALSAAEHATFVARIDRGTAHAALSEEARRWLLQPGERVFGRLAQQAQRLAQQLSKEIDVTVSDGGLRLAADPLRAVLSALVHAVRNAVDHGIESPEERRAAGKSPRGALGVALRAEGDLLRVEITDDGRGVDWSRVASRAAAMGLPTNDQAALADSLFRDGLSTRDEVTALSGRGVGLSAIRAACRALDGDCVLREGAGGVGTTLVCTVSLARATTVALTEVAARRSSRPMPLAV